MSTISVSGLSTFFQSNSTGAAPQVQGPQQVDASQDADGSTQAVHPHHHHHGGGGQAFFSKLQAAVTTALDAAKSDGSTDPNQAVQNAIESVLKGQNSSQADLSGDGSSDGTQAASTSDSGAPVDPHTAREEFFQTLQSYGVNPQQFHQDFLAALNDARNGNADPSGALQSLPPGSMVDTTG